MSALRKAVGQYLELRRGLGFKMDSQAFVLRRFVDFAEREGAESVTTELVLRWTKQPNRALPTTWKERVGTVRVFATWYQAYDPRTEPPPKSLLPFRYRRKPPYIYSDDEVAKIVEAMAQIQSRRGVRGLTWSTFFALIAVTGMRISEAIALDRGDVDLDDGVITVRQAKHGKDRYLPLHSSTRLALADYAKRRDRLLGKRNTSAFFLSEQGNRVGICGARYMFAKVSQDLGIRPRAPGHGHGPRIHDLRHRFAVRTMIDWYRSGRNVEAEIPRLATYLGHVHVQDTFWYLEGIPELLQLATERLQNSRGVTCQ